MSVRRKTENRLTLYRTCHICGKEIVTTAASPFMRQMYNVDGKKQKICYFCSETCKNASYIHKFDGRAEERHRAKDKLRDIREKNKRYYENHTEEIREKKRQYYSERPGLSAKNSKYQRRKQKLLQEEHA